MKRFWSLAMVLVMLAGVLGMASPGSTAQAAPEVLTQLQANRRAAQLLEDMRDSDMARNWSKATLGGVRALVRPDLKYAGYFEYSVLNAGKPAGFIIVSTSPHDFPIAHWNDQGESPSAYLSRVALEKQQKVNRFYKLDALTYAGENSAGELIALYPPNSRLPTSVQGQDPGSLDQKVALSHETWTPVSRDEKAPGKHRQSQSGPAPTDRIKLGGWDSWKQFKSSFVQSYDTMLKSLSRQADHDWAIDRSAAQSGEGLIVGQDCKRIASLYGKVNVGLRGDGAKFAEATVRTRTGLLPFIELCAIESPSQEGTRLDVVLTYGNGTTETLPFAVLSESFADTNPNAPRAAQPQGASADFAKPLGAWSAWTYYWAGSSSDQRYYEQISANTYNNTTSCYSGCGATAWAMLFGWADKQAASGNAYWAPRWGIYRANGGTGADAVAPQYQNSGIRTITMDIRNRIGTFCSFGSGATAPWDMDGAAGYLSGRTGTRLSTHYNVLGIHEDRLREYARNSIRDRDTPAVIGTGWLTHYPLAWGYAWQSRTVNVLWWTETEYNRWFYVNQGWGGSGDGWVSASTWFAGEITP